MNDNVVNFRFPVHLGQLSDDDLAKLLFALRDVREVNEPMVDREAGYETHWNRLQSALEEPYIWGMHEGMMRIVKRGHAVTVLDEDFQPVARIVEADLGRWKFRLPEGGHWITQYVVKGRVGTDGFWCGDDKRILVDDINDFPCDYGARAVAKALNVNL